MANYVKVTGAETGKVYNVPVEDFAGSYDDYVKNSAGAKVEMYDMDGNKKSVDIADARDMYGKGYTYWQGQHNHYAGKIRYAEARKKAAEEEAKEKEPASVAAEARKVVRASMPDKKPANTPSAVPPTKSETPTAEPTTEEAEATQKSAPTATTQSKKPESQPLTEAEKMQMMYGTGMQQIAQTVGNTQRTVNKIKQQTKKANHPLDADRKIKLGENRKTITETTFNPQTGKQEISYIDEFGNEHANRAVADLVGNIVDQHNSEQYNIDAELRDAEAELARLNEEKAAAREARGKTIGVTMNTPGTIMTRDETRYSLEDRAYDAAIRQTEQRIKDIKEERDSRNGEDVGFWRAFGRVTGDTRTWDFGVGDARDATTMLQLQGENELTDSEKKARGVLMEQLYKAQQTEQKYGGNRDFWYRAGVTTGYMPAFMLDFAAAELTGGGSTISAGAKIAAKVATKAIGKQAVEEIAKLGLKQYIKSEGKRGIGKYAANWAIKALGTTADELLVRAPLMTNTIQANKTYADVVGRKLGDVTRDENGNFSFKNSKSWGDAVWQGEANAIIENYSEMFGTHLDPVLSLKNAERVANALGAGRISAMISKASNAGLQSAMGQTQKLFEKLGVSDYFGEVSEEYYGQLWRTMLNLDDAYIDNGDGTRTNNFLNAQFHGDILGGMALSMGMIGGVKAGFNAANYGRLKKNLRNYEAEARTLLGDDEWEVIKSGIQGCTNEDIGKLIASIYESEDYTDEDKRAILRYTEGSLRLRGYDMADLKQKEQETQRQQWEQPNEELATEAGQTIATEAAPLSEQPNPQVVIDESQEYRDAQSALAEAENKMRTELPSLDTDGLLEGVDLASVSTEQLTELLPSLPPKVRDAVVEYISARNVANNAAARHQAVLDGISGQIDEAVDNYYNANVSNNDEGAADVVVYNDENGQSWYVRSGLYGESVLLMDENGNVKWMPSSDIDSSRLVLYDKETQMEGLRTYLQERITQEYGLGEQEQAETEGGIEPTPTPTEAVEPTQTETTTQTETPTPTEAVQTEEAVQQGETSAQTEETAQRPEIPTDKDGNKLYFENQVEPSVAVDDILADLDDDMGVADEAVGQELAAARKGLQKVSNEKANGIAGQKAKKAKIRIAQGAVDYWQSVADEITKRKLAARQEKEAALAAEAAALQQANESEGQVPEWRHDTPESARQRGYRVSEGERYDRQGNVDGIVGRESKAVFTNKDGDTKTGNLMLVDINSVQESHRGDGKNPYHFIPEAQPKDRTSSASRTDTAVNAKPGNFKPELLTGDGVVYNESAPVINARGEVIQGNGRVMTLRDVYKNPESAAAYKAYLKEHAAEFGLTPEDVDKMENPILVNRIDVDDNEAIRLGQFKATDLESGGSQRIEPRETIRKMGDWFGNFVNQMFSGDEEMSVAQLIDANGVKVLKYMNAKGIISNTQMETAVKDGELTAEGKNDLMRLLKHKLFEDAPTELETMFQKLPVKAQKAILATYLRDNEVPVESSITNDIRASIMAFYELMQMENFKDATTYEGAKKAISDWLRQQNMFESVANKDKFSTFALELAAREKVLSQKAMTELLNTYYDMVSERTGVAGELFNEADNNVYTKAEAVKKLFNVDLNENKKDNGNGLQGSDALAGDGGPRGEGRQGSSGDAASRKQDASGAKPSDSRRGAGRDGAEGTEDVKEAAKEDGEKPSVAERRRARRGFRDVMPRKTPEEVFAEWQKKASGWVTEGSQYAADSKEAVVSSKTWQEAYDKLRKKAEDYRAKADEWRKKVYKKHDGSVEVGGKYNDLDATNVRIDYINERRRENAIRNLEGDAKHFEELAEKLKTEATKYEIPSAPAKKVDKPWSEMNGEERLAAAEKNPLTEEEIRDKTSEENADLIEDAVDYLNGNRGFTQQIAYLKIFDDVRNRHEDAADNSGTKDGTQLAASDNGGGEGMGLGTGRDSRGTDEQLDRGTDSETAPGERERGEGSTDNADSTAGERSDKQGEGTAPELGPVSSGSADTARGGRAGTDGDASKRSGRKGGSGSAKSDAKRKPAAKQGTTWRGRSDAEIKKEAKDAKAGLKAALAEMAKRGRGQLSLSLVGLNQAQIEYVPELMKAVKRYGMSLIDQGIYKVKEWMGNVHDAIHDDMSDMGFSDKDIDEFIEEMWNSKMPMDGEVHTIAEWSSIYEKSQLREKLKETLTDKRELQKAAESIAVKIGDMKNIEETLPFLLPQQQEDVYRAEVQLFGADHADRDHAYGKGYLFTNGTGTGKTYTGLGIAKRFAKQGKGRILFLTPSQQKVSDWIKDGYNLGLDIKDLDKVAKEKGTTATNESGDGMVITTYANMRQNKKLLETEWDAVIYDESHRILENKKGTQTTGSQQHYMLTNRDEKHCFTRLRLINPAYKKMQLAADLFDEAREKEIARIKKEYEENHPDTAESDVLVAVGKLAPKSLGEFTPADAAQFPSLAKLYKNYSEASQHYLKDVEPKLKEQAKNTWKNTKTVFLSATPFNTRENLGYAEGYIFKFPEEEKGGRMTGRTRFYLDNFGAAYSFRYGRLESKTNNPEAVAKQEIAFSDYMQNELGTMSGRIIDSPYDYSRDFPLVAPDKAEEFNAAVQSAVRSRHLCGAYFKSIGEYNYGSALFETMKVATSVERIKEHLDAGRKVVIFHRRVETKEPITPPFEYMLQVANEEIAHMRPGKDRNEYIQEAKNFRNTYGDLLQWEQTLDYSMPRVQLAKVFGADNVLFFSGKESKSVKSKAVDTFNDDNSGKNIIVIQEASGKEGISLHDTTGEHQRVCITLALPQSPITALQIEGRIYRIGNKSNAIFEYPLLGLNSEMMLFGQKFNAQVSTTENLALGSQARNLRDSFARGVLEHSGIVPVEQQGVGGKEFDAPKVKSDDPYGDAVLDYYSNQKLNKNNREGEDYFPTPEPLGYKMVEWANLGEGDTVLEPSAGHGAIARYVPQSNPLLSIEPSQSLFAKLQLKAGGLGRKFLNDIFENFDIKNKRDAVVMNPPFGTAGATAIAHVDKAYKHLDEGGRLVALIPRGAMDKKFEKWYNEQNNAVLRAEVDLPSILFEQAGTNVRCRVVVVDKITDSAMRGKAGYPEKIDLSGNYAKIEDFFDDLRDVELPERIVDAKLKAAKKAHSFKKDLEEIRGIKIEYLDRDNISVWDKHSHHYYTIDFRDSNKDEATIYYANKYKDFDNRLNIVYDESSKEALGVMKKIACKLADMSEDEMLRYIEGKPDGVLYRTGEESEKSAREEGVAETKQSVEALKREQLERKRAYAQSVIDNYGGKGRVVADASELDETGKRALRENKRMTGYYDPKTGEVVVYLPNCSSQVEVERTVLHEKVGHEGLRGLLGGKEQHKKFLQKIYLGMSKETRSEINARMQRNGWSLYEAMDEYLAEAAETFTSENRSLWQKLKDVWNDTMRSLGFKQGSTEADIRTALWLSANRLRENESSLEYKLRRAVFNSALKRYHPTEATSRNGYTWGDEHKVDEDGDFIPDLLYRTSRMSDEDRDAATRNLTPEGRDCLRRYNERLANWKYAWREAHYDRLASVRDMLDVILHPKKGEKIASKYDIASKIEALGSKNQQEQEKFQREHANPLLRKIGELQTYFNGKTPGERYRQFEAYMYVKHALERNRTLFVRDAIKAMAASEDPVLQAKSATAQQEYDAERNRLLDELDKGNIDLREFYTQLDGWINTNIAKFDAAKHDMSGLSDVDSALMKSLGISIDKKGAYNEDAALDFVLNSESRMGRNNVDEVWSMVNAISRGNVEREYNAGLMNQKARDRMNSMFAWYLPLRGFDAKTSDEVYGYIGEGDMHGFTSNPKTKGRTSTAETPISTLLAMSDYSIFRSNKNQMKYSLVMLARDHQNDLVTEYETWYQETVDANGNKVLEPSYPDLREGMTAAEITQAIEDHEDAIRQKKDAGETWVKLKDEKTNSPYRIVSPKQRNQHIVSCMIDGKKVDILIHGNPRAAQAINGMVHDTHWAIWDNANHALSQLMTSYSLSFMGRNKLRDMEYALASGLTENAKMGERWNRNFAKIYAQLDFLNPSSRAVGDRLDANGNRVKMQDKVQSALKLFSLYRQGKLDMNNEIHRYFSEFVSNGGMTGYTQMHAREDFEAQIQKTLAEHFDKQSGNKAVRFAQMSGKEAAKFFESYFGAVEKLNEAIENQTRFAAYCASRMERRNVTRSIADAKDISINFNRTGAGWATHSLRVGNEGMGWKLNRDAAALTATYMRHSQWFYNAAIQGMVRNIKLFKDGDTTQRLRFVLSMVLTPMLLAAVSRMSGMLVAAMMDGDDDKKKYGKSPLDQLPDFVRRQNFCIYLGHGRFALIPLSVELRAPYGLMDVCERAMQGIPSEKGYGAEMFEQLTQLTPYDLGGGSKVGSNDWIGSAAGVVTPSNLQGIIACATNVKWTGGPVSGRSDYNASEAEWQRGLSTTSPFFVQGARFMSTDFSNALADAADKMGFHDTATSWRGDPKGVKGGLVDINPAWAQYLVETYLGGPGKDWGEYGAYAANKVSDVKEYGWGSLIGKEGAADLTRTPIVKAFTRSATPTNAMAANRSRWYTYNKEYNDETKPWLKGMTKHGETVDAKLLKHSKKGKIGAVVAAYSPIIKEIQARKNAAKTNTEREYMQWQMNDYINKAIATIDEIEKQ